MSDLHLQVPVDRPADDVAQLLRVRPSTWLRPFLRMATREAVPGDVVEAGPPWYRLGAVAVEDDDVHVVPFTWWPHVDNEQAFARFEGRLAVRPSADGAVLVAAGQAEGGVDEVNTAVIAALLTTLGTALSCDQGGP